MPLILKVVSNNNANLISNLMRVNLIYHPRTLLLIFQWDRKFYLDFILKQDYQQPAKFKNLSIKSLLYPPPSWTSSTFFCDLCWGLIVTQELNLWASHSCFSKPQQRLLKWTVSTLYGVCSFPWIGMHFPYFQKVRKANTLFLKNQIGRMKQSKCGMLLAALLQCKCKPFARL